MTERERIRLAEALSAAGGRVKRGPDCPQDAEIWAASRGELPVERAQEILDHSQECAACAESLQVAAALGTEVAAATAAHRPAERVAPFRMRRRRIAVIAGLLAASLLVAVALRLALAPQRAVPGTPLADAVRIELWRTGGQADERLSSGAAIAAGDRLYLTVEQDIPIYLYVINQDPAGVPAVLFPSAEAQRRNPLPPGTRHRLPGDRTWENDSWEVSAATGAESLVLIATRVPVEALEAAAIGASVDGGLRGPGAGPDTSGSADLSRAIAALLARPPAPEERLVREIRLEHRP